MNIGITYEIRDKSNPDLVYYGSSELSLDERMKLHIQSFNYWKKTGKNYCYSFKVLELENYKPTLLKIIFFTVKWELWEHERKLIESNECCNHNIPNRTKAEYYQDYYQNNKDKKLKQVADYRLKNKDKINKKFACGCGGKFTKPHAAEHKKSKKHLKWTLSQSQKNK